MYAVSVYTYLPFSVEHTLTQKHDHTRPTSHKLISQVTTTDDSKRRIVLLSS